VRPRTTRISGIGTLHELTVAYEDKPTVALGGTVASPIACATSRTSEAPGRGRHHELRFAKMPMDLALAPAAETGKTIEREFRS